MPQREIVGTMIDFNEEGFMTDPGQWNEDIARELAKEIDIELNERHLTVISGVGTKELYQLFPKGPAKKAARVAGLGKPEGCI